MTLPATSQNIDHVVAVATTFIEAHLGHGLLQWNEVIDHLRVRGYSNEATLAVTRAVLDLERTDVMFYGIDGMRRLRGGDTAPADLVEVAAAVLSLEWPCTRNDRPGGSRSIWEAFEELEGRYRHCDVYDAMHDRLKGHELKSGRVWWQRTDLPSRFDRAGRFAVRADAVAGLSPYSPPRQKLEADLIADYVVTLPHRFIREYAIGDLRADVYEPSVRRIVEAKAAMDAVTISHAWAQAAAYRYAINIAASDERNTVESIAVLLPAPPSGIARSFLEHVAADCLAVELIYPEGDSFRRELLD